MTTFFPNRSQVVVEPRFWLAGTGICLGLIHLSVSWRSGELDFLGLSVLFWLAIASLFWDKRQQFIFQSGIFAIFFSSTLMALLLIKSLFLTGGEFFPRIYPLIAVLSLVLMVSGFKGIAQYWRELLISFLMGGLEIVLPLVIEIDPSFLTAKFATYLLWYFGVDVTQQGTNIYFTTGAVDVRDGCSGLAAIMHLLSLSALCLLMFPLARQTKILLPILAILLGFTINGLRVALMTILVMANQQETFQYWHKGEGSLLFSLVSVGLFGGVCLWLLQQEKP